MIEAPATEYQDKGEVTVAPVTEITPAATADIIPTLALATMTSNSTD